MDDLYLNTIKISYKLVGSDIFELKGVKIIKHKLKHPYSESCL